ncbi:DUF4329 domain-containing protein [Glacieibacterium frigidum]|uniref:DUF4329 domain-containing protein n=1 Tax=Glacieibacterium frigidum TaxID=2593303 RepID=A0A552UHF2_9SPHN|nr:DUF4329 domain-containing protein [Glacieibacterium frigidum]TRW17642.1 DUF4329 domain-containing protein [Glacieibacterium frigidum]
MLESVQATGRSAASAPASPPSPVERARELGAAGDIAGAAALVRERPDLRGTVEDALLQAGNPGGIGDLADALKQAVEKAIDTVRDVVAKAADAVTAAAAARTGFPNVDAAARAALTEANPQSIRENLEFGGLVYKSPDGTYGYTAPARGTSTGFDPTSVTIPSGTTLVGDFHTHADYSIVDASGNVVRTSDPARDDFNSDQFSTTDLRGIAADAAGKPEYRGYLGTPSGNFRVFDPAANTNTILR